MVGGLTEPFSSRPVGLVSVSVGCSVVRWPQQARELQRCAELLSGNTHGCLSGDLLSLCEQRGPGVPVSAPQPPGCSLPALRCSPGLGFLIH